MYIYISVKQIESIYEQTELIITIQNRKYIIKRKFIHISIRTLANIKWRISLLYRLIFYTLLYNYLRMVSEIASTNSSIYTYRNFVSLRHGNFIVFPRDLLF